MSGLSFRRIGGRIIPLFKKTGVGKLARSVVASSKVSSQISKSKKLVKGAESFRAKIPGLQKQYKGLRYESLLDVEDARQVHSIRLGHAKQGRLSGRLKKLKGVKSKAIKRATAEVGVVSAGLASVVNYMTSKRNKK